MTIYNMVNTDVLATFTGKWAGAGAAPSDVAVAIALCMPSVSEGGVRTQRNVLVTGKQAAYHACALRHGDGNPTAGLVDNEYFATMQALEGQGYKPSTKTNHLKWLTQAGLITTVQMRGQPRISMLTEAGVAQVKAAGGAELAKLAKAYTDTARAKALKALERARLGPVLPRLKARKSREQVADEAIATALATGGTVDLDRTGFAIVHLDPTEAGPGDLPVRVEYPEGIDASSPGLDVPMPD